MSEVKRYEIGGPDWEMDESPIGEYVTWDDHNAECQRLRAELAALKAQPVGQEPAAEVSEETFSSDGTSDIITRKLPIGTKLYTAPQPAPAQDVAGLVEALQEVRYRVEQDRIWNGMGWTFTGIGPHKQPRIIELIDDALAAHDKQSGEVKS
jgi:hypothetical protein